MPFILLVLALFTFAGCASPRQAPPAPVYQPRNLTQSALPQGFSRIALLPIVSSPDQGILEARQTISQSIIEELLKSKRFEVLVLSPDDLQELAGVSQLTSLDVWPDRLRQGLQDRQVDGVMLVEITHLKGYAPIALGLKARLVGLATGSTYWALDDVFDTSDASVLAGAKRFESGMLMSVGRGKTQGTIELSPSIFAKYAAATIFETLP